MSIGEGLREVVGGKDMEEIHTGETFHNPNQSCEIAINRSRNRNFRNNKLRNRYKIFTA